MKFDKKLLEEAKKEMRDYITRKDIVDYDCKCCFLKNFLLYKVDSVEDYLNCLSAKDLNFNNLEAKYYAMTYTRENLQEVLVKRLCDKLTMDLGKASNKLSEILRQYFSEHWIEIYKKHCHLDTDSLFKFYDNYDCLMNDFNKINTKLQSDEVKEMCAREILFNVFETENIIREFEEIQKERANDILFGCFYYSGKGDIGCAAHEEFFQRFKLLRYDETRKEYIYTKGE